MTYLKRTLWCVYGFLWLGGLITGGISKPMPWAAPLFLVLAGALAILENRPAWKTMAIAAVVGFSLELMGVHTGYPFGRYAYSDVLFPAIAGVPLAIVFAWIILIDFVRAVTPDLLWGSLLMAAIDLVIDPLAAGPLGYWEWFEHGRYYGIPAINFVGWWLAAVLILTMAPKQPLRNAYVGWTVVGFFSILAVEKHLYTPAAIGALILLTPLLSHYFYKKPSN